MSPLLLAVTREDVGDYVITLAYVYVVLIFVRVLMSYFTRIPYYRWLDAILTFVHEVTEPLLRVFRRLLPPVRLGPAALDLTPVVATFALIIGGSIVAGLIRG